MGTLSREATLPFTFLPPFSPGDQLFNPVALRTAKTLWSVVGLRKTLLLSIPHFGKVLLYKEANE